MSKLMPVDDHLAALLAAGGMRATPSEADGPEVSWRISPYQAWRHVSGAEQLGQLLAERLGALDYDCVVTWEVDDLVLAHVVARSSGATIAIGFDESGLAYLAGDVRPGTRAVLLADAFRSASIPQTLSGLVQHHRGVVVAACSLVNTPATRQLDPNVANVALLDDPALLYERSDA